MSKKGRREKDPTADYFGGDYDDDRALRKERFSDKSKHFQQRKTEKTAILRLAEEEQTGDIDSLPTGTVLQVYSMFCEVRCEEKVFLCVVRRTLTKVSKGFIVVGDRVKFRPTDITDAQGRPEGIIEKVLPRESLLTRTDSFKGVEQHPIVANAGQMLIVASLIQPRIKWGLIDRMVIAAEGGSLRPILCLNKIDLVDPLPEDAVAILAHYESLGVRIIRTSISRPETITQLTDILRDQTTVLAGHSGVGKSSLIRAVEPSLDLRIGAISNYNDKGRHTTTSARWYALPFGGFVIDTPGVKLFGLWNVTRDNLDTYFPDVAAGTAPDWRKESYTRIAESLAG
jgi:ribosome biogenesis GTPase / thiamine phosphate phosphatase